MSERLEQYTGFFESLSLETLDRLSTVLTEDAHFKDPFNDVVGLKAIRRIFEHMYRETDRPEFRVLGSSEQGDTGYLHWEMHYAFRRHPGKRLRIEGMSRIRFATDGRVLEHVDFWDPVEGLLGHLPAVGGVFRWTAARLRTPQG